MTSQPRPYLIRKRPHPFTWRRRQDQSFPFSVAFWPRVRWPSIEYTLKKIICSAAPVLLHVGLKSICRVHGLTPHRSTGRCPFELHREGPSVSLFPNSKLKLNGDQDVLVDQNVDMVSITSDSSSEQDIDVSDVILIINVPRRARRCGHFRATFAHKKTMMSRVEFFLC